MKKLTVIILVFLVLINISCFVFGYALNVTEEDLTKARKKENWTDFYNRFVNHMDGEGLSDVDLIRMLQGPTKDEMGQDYSTDDLTWIKEYAQKLADTRAQGGELDTKEWAKLRKEALAKYREILGEKDADKLKKLKEEYIQIVEKMMKKDAKATTEDTDIYGPYNTYTAELNKNNNLYENRVGEDGKTQEGKTQEGKNNKIYKQPNIVTGDAKKDGDGTLDDMISDAGSFVSKGDQTAVATIETDGLKDLSGRIYNILLEIGIGAAVLIGIILGIKFLLSGVEEKAQVKKMIWVYSIGCIVTFGAFGIWKIVVTILQQL